MGGTLDEIGAERLSREQLTARLGEILAEAPQIVKGADLRRLAGLVVRATSEIVLDLDGKPFLPGADLAGERAPELRRSMEALVRAATEVRALKVEADIAKTDPVNFFDLALFGLLATEGSDPEVIRKDVDKIRGLVDTVASMKLAEEWRRPRGAPALDSVIGRIVRAACLYRHEQGLRVHRSWPAAVHHPHSGWERERRAGSCLTDREIGASNDTAKLIVACLEAYRIVGGRAEARHQLQKYGRLLAKEERGPEARDIAPIILLPAAPE